MVIFQIAWGLLVVTLFVVDPHPHFDMHHCSTNRETFTRYCFPKDGCYLDGNGDAFCWRAARLTR